MTSKSAGDTVSQITESVVSRRAVLKAGAAFGAMFALAPLLAACAGPTGSGGTQTTLTLGLNRSLVSLDNKLNQFDAAVTVQRAVRQALTKIGDDLLPEPVLAESFEQTGDLEWTVVLREGIVYSDGTPVTVDDVATAIEMYRTTPGGSFVGGQFPEWPTLTPVDDRTFTLTTTTPLVVLDSLMSNILITPAADNEPAELQDGIGTGPYVVTDANSGTGSYTLEANEEYWGDDAASIPTVQVRFMSEESSRVAALRSGEVDVIDSITPESISQLEGVDGVVIESVTGTRFNHLHYNFRKPADHPLANAEVRRALSLAIDGDTIAETILGGAVTVANGVVPQTLSGWAEVGSFEFDPDRAASELERLGATGMSLKLIWESGEWPGDAQTMEAIVGMLSDVGVTLELQQFEAGGDINTWRRGEGGDWDILGNGYGNQTGLSLTNLTGMYGGTAEREETRDAYLGFVVPEVSDAIEQALAERDQAQRDQVLADVQQQIWDLAPVAWAFVPNAVLARREVVEGIDLRAINSYDLSSVTLR